MPLPPALQAQADAADATLRQMYPATHGAQELMIADSVPPIPVPALPASDAQPPAPPQPQYAQPQPPSPPEDELTWEQRYRSLQGIHNSHVASLKERLAQADAERAQLIQQLASRSAEPAAQPQPASANPQDVETFGEDLVRMIQRTATELMNPVAQAYEQRIAQLESALQGTNKVVAQTADEAFFSQLREQVPDFDQINSSDPFLAWLAEPDDLTGAPRQTALTAAGNARDLKRVVRVFNAFKSAAGVAPAAPAAPASPTSRLQAQVSPRSTGNGATAVASNADGKPMITVEQVERFYSDVRRGAYRSNEPLRAATEQVINDALADNRIIQRGMHRPAP